jgi:uncharacterized membrane protein (UPF0127 family)
MTRLKRLARHLLLLLLASPACSEAGSRQARAADAEVRMLSQRGKVTIRTGDGRQLQLDVEIASNDPDRARGLMFRKTMPEMAGMIFVFPDDVVRSFWMKNTYLPLDMLFIAADGKVVGIVENAEPLTVTPRSVDANAKYVLEVNGGWCARHGVVKGDKVSLEGSYQLQ